MPQHATITSFRPGQSGNPRGRTPGTVIKRTIEVRDLCNRLVDDPKYRASLRRRLLAGTAGAMEVLLWHYAYGKPIARVETGEPGAFSDLSDDELKLRLAEAIRRIDR